MAPSRYFTRANGAPRTMRGAICGVRCAQIRPIHSGEEDTRSALRSRLECAFSRSVSRLLITPNERVHTARTYVHTRLLSSNHARLPRSAVLILFARLAICQRPGHVTHRPHSGSSVIPRAPFAALLSGALCDRGTGPPPRLQARTLLV